MEKPTDETPKPMSWRWPIHRLSRAVFLYASGYSPDEIGRDLFVQSNAVNVRRALRRAGVYDGGPLIPMRFSIDMSRDRLEAWRRAARARNVPADVLVRKAAEILADDPILLDNILDDGV